jgi:cell division protein FtsA
MNEYIVGIDIGSSKVSAAAGKFDKLGSLQIVGVTTARCNGVNKGIVVDIDRTSESIKSCIDQLERMIDGRIEEAYISFPGVISSLVPNKGVVAVSSEDKEIKENDVKRVIRAAKIIPISSDREIIEVIPNQYIVDGCENIKDPEGMSGTRLELDALLVTAQSTFASNIMKSLNKAGIKVNGIVFEPLASSAAALNVEEIEMGTALLDIGAETTNISVFKDGKLVYNEHVNLGGSTITSDIAIVMKIPHSQAEQLKIKYGMKGHDSNNNTVIQLKADFNNEVTVDLNIVKQIIEARIEEILILLNKKIRGSGFDSSIAGMVIVGGGISQFEGIEEFGKSILLMPFRIADLNYPGATSPVYATAVGVVKNVAELLKEKPAAEGSEASKSKGKSKGSRKDDDFDEDYDDEYDSERENEGLLGRIKGFFSEFF